MVQWCCGSASRLLVLVRPGIWFFPMKEKLKNLQSEEEENAVEVKRNPTDSTENLLSRVNNSSSVSKSSEEGTDMYEKSAKPAGGSKFHQLLSAKPRADAVAAG
ncbi:common plant regulatory factor 1-like [Silene latifolia]|uniref:common plant regulatory factor 1-like n=1 Tax=Silene latifolia TaxID=37657 RepID=UPI003D78A8A0